MSWNIQVAGKPDKVAEAVSKRVETEKGFAHNSQTSKDVLGACDEVVKQFCNSASPNKMVLAILTGHIDTSSQQAEVKLSTVASVE